MARQDRKHREFERRGRDILAAALELCSNPDWESVTVEQIADRAEVGKGTVYKHFLTKNEILVRIMLDYERSITTNLAKGIASTEEGDPGAAAKAYFNSRLERPELDRLVQHLEVRLDEAEDIREQMLQLHELRRSNEQALEDMIQRQIDRGVLEDVPPRYHYLAAWALTQGAVELCFNKSWNYHPDSDGLVDFITAIGVTMGNRGQYRKP